MSGYVQDLVGGVASILVSLRVTLRYLFTPAITTQYPDERLPLPERYRGRPELLRNRETGLPACTACGVCVRACPHGCIVLESHMGPDKKRVVDKFTIDLGRCIMCRTVLLIVTC